MKNRHRAAKPLPDAQQKPGQKGRASEKASQQKPWFQKIQDKFPYNLNTPDNYAVWIYPAIAAGTKIIQEYGIRNIFSSSPPGSSHVVAYYLKKRTGADWIADFRDPWRKSAGTILK